MVFRWKACGNVAYLTGISKTVDDVSHLLQGIGHDYSQFPVALLGQLRKGKPNKRLGGGGGGGGYKCVFSIADLFRVQELCESRGGRPGLSVLMSLTVSVDVKQH